MKLTVLGCGAAYPRPGGACSGWLFETGQDRLWVDAGHGTLSRLQLMCSIEEVDALVLTHAHADHISDVIPLMYALYFDTERRRTPMHAPDEVLTRLFGMLGETSVELFRKVFDVSTLAEPFRVGGLGVQPFPTMHPIEAFGLRVSAGGRTVVYTSDTAAHPGLAESCREADLLVCEATYVSTTKAEPGVHMWAREAGELAASAGAGRLVLTHIWPTNDPAVAVAEASEVYDGPVEAAVDGAVYEL